MAFFDNFTKKVTEATQSLSQKGKDFAETGRLNQALAEEEKSKGKGLCRDGKA